MANGKLLEQLRSLSEQSRIPAEEALPILFAAFVDLYERMDTNQLTDLAHREKILEEMEKIKQDEKIYRAEHEEDCGNREKRLDALESQERTRIAKMSAVAASVGVAVTVFANLIMDFIN